MFRRIFASLDTANKRSPAVQRCIRKKEVFVSIFCQNTSIAAHLKAIDLRVIFVKTHTMLLCTLCSKYHLVSALGAMKRWWKDAKTGDCRYIKCDINVFCFFVKRQYCNWYKKCRVFVRYTTVMFCRVTGLCTFKGYICSFWIRKIMIQCQRCDLVYQNALESLRLHKNRI